MRVPAAGLVLLAFASSLNPIAAEEPASPRLRQLAARVESLLDQKAPGDGPAVTQVRNDFAAFLKTDEGKRSLEAALAMLAKLPSTSPNAPRTPEFPFDADAARRYQRDYAAWRGLPVEATHSLGMRLVLVPPGAFRMGSPDDEPGHGTSDKDETLHPVTLTQPFYLGAHEVTVGQFGPFVEAAKYQTDGERNGGGNAHDERAVWKHRPGTHWKNPGYAGPYTQRDDHPVVHVSHADCGAFCEWLNRERGNAVGVTYALPTESQWEWACRAGSAARFWWGSDEDTTGKVANVGDAALKRTHPEWPRVVMPMDDGHAFPAPVGTYRANGFGLHDMLGNVWELCSTHYGPYPRGAVADPEGGDENRGFAVRGGGWSNVAEHARCATREADPPHFCHSNLGFRVRLSLPK